MSKIALIINERSGSGAKQKALYKALEAYQDDVHIFDIFAYPSIKNIVAKAWEEGIRIMIAAGGDGTVSSVASAILELGLDAKLGVIPVGTLNHFAHDIGMPKSIEESVEIIMKGNSAFMDAVKINNKYFINNSSLGMYPFMVNERQSIKHRWYGKWVGMALSGFTTLKRYPFITVEFENNGKRLMRKTPFIFIGNNSYNISAGNLGTRKKLNEGKLSIFIAHSLTRMALIKLLWHAVRGRLLEQKDFDAIGLSKVEIKSRKRKIHVALDGEVVTMRGPLHYSIVPKALHVIIP
jgi:YegS/Rv2252/BmrU family lipid kinase